MNKFVKVGRLFFGIGIVAFGIQQFLYGDFVAGRAPVWPASIPGRLVWAYASGLVLIGAGVAIILGKKVRLAGILTGTMIFLWALLRHIPLVVVDPSFGGAWTNAGKALAFFGGAFAIAGTERAMSNKSAGVVSRRVNSTDGFIYLGRYALGIFMIFSGIQHFLFGQFVALLVPRWIPGPYFWAYFAGVALIAGGVGLMVPKTARLAATLSGVMIFLWFVLLHIPRAVAARNDANEWIAVFEALAVSGIAFVLAGASRDASKKF
jgi:uncharacterized membrane protein